MSTSPRAWLFRSVVVTALAAALVPLGCSPEDTGDEAALQGGYDATPDRRMHDVMEAKLLHAHVLMDAIAVEDFRRIEQNAQALSTLSEQSDWFIHSTPTYRIHSETFREAATAMVEHARAADIQNVSADYVDLLACCYDCHRYLRAEGLVRDMPGVISGLVIDQEPGG